jgi:hypothetical protein
VLISHTPKSLILVPSVTATSSAQATGRTPLSGRHQYILRPTKSGGSNAMPGAEA